MLIRKADLSKDALAIMDGARDFRSQVSFGSLFPEDDNEFIEAVGKIVSLENVEVIVAEHNHVVVGGIGIIYAPYIWNPKRLVADELFWWASKNAPSRTGWKLIEQAMKDIDQRNAIPMFSALETSPDSVRRIYGGFGMKPIETRFARF